jgi:hypothetical protein
MLVTATEFAMRWGEEYPRIESVAVETIGSKLRLMLAPWESIAPGLQYCTSEDGEEWNDWADMPILGAVDVPYPGYFKFRCIYAPATVRFYNLKTAAEADSLTGLTVVAGECEVRLIE